jgi:hypothetical protein
MRSSRGLVNDQQFFSKVYVWVLFISGFYYFVFSRVNTLILGTSKDYNSPLSLQGRSYTRWV